jgi:hypothetical protein
MGPVFQSRGGIRGSAPVGGEDAVFIHELVFIPL